MLRHPRSTPPCRLVALLLALALPWLAPPPASAAPHIAKTSAAARVRRIAILCYHHIAEERGTKLDVVSPAYLRAQIQSAKQAGFTFLSLEAVLAHRDKPEALPPKVMVLTFDDGYRSFVEQALPILRDEHVPATIALVTSWLEQPPEGLPPLMSWDDVRDAKATGLVQVSSHTHALHRYEMCNPWRDTWTAVGTRRYWPDAGRYENRDEYRVRLRDDLALSQQTLERELGQRAGTLVWPYGDYNGMARTIAEEQGFPVTLSLSGRLVTPEDLRAGLLPRYLMTRDADSSSTAWLDGPPKPMRAAQVDLDQLYDPDTTAFARRVDVLVDDLRAMGATHVFLQGCPDPRGDARFDATWFANHQLAVRADVWSMVARKLQHASMRVWIRAPVMNLAWIWEAHPEWRIPFDPNRDHDDTAPWYFRLSPDLAESRRAAMDFYTDLAVYLPIDGVLFDDDAYMLPGEGLSGNRDATPADKAAAIDALIEDVKVAVREWRPEAKFARNVYAPVVEKSGVHPRFAQDFVRIARANDLTVVMAYAHMEGHGKDATKWTKSITRRALSRAASAGPGGRRAPVMIKLQAYDWEKNAEVPGSELTSLARAARKAGAANIGVYPAAGLTSPLPAGLLDVPRTDTMATEESRH